MRFHVWSDKTTRKQVPRDIPGLDGLLPHCEARWVESLTTGCANGDIDGNLIG